MQFVMAVFVAHPPEAANSVRRLVLVNIDELEVSAADACPAIFWVEGIQRAQGRYPTENAAYHGAAASWLTHQRKTILGSPTPVVAGKGDAAASAVERVASICARARSLAAETNYNYL